MIVSCPSLPDELAPDEEPRPPGFDVSTTLPNGGSMSKLTTLDDLRLWAAAHAAAQEARDEAQATVNARVDKIESRVSSLEKRVMFASGVAAAAGALGGTLLQQVF